MRCQGSRQKHQLSGGEGREGFGTEKTHGICESDLARNAKKMMEKRQKLVGSPSSRTNFWLFSTKKKCYPEVEPWYLDFEQPRCSLSHAYKSSQNSTISSGSSANFHPISPLFLIGYFVAQRIFFPIQHVGIDISLFNMFPIQHFGIIFVPI